MKNGYKILIIEDNNDVRDNIEEILQAEDYEVFVAENGSIGLDVAAKTQPDLILCDVMMPEMDGYEVLKNIRHNVATSITPFIFLTAKNTREDLRKGMKLGADDYISKPFTIDELLDSVSARLKKHEEFTKKSEEKLNELTHNMGVPITNVISEPMKAIIGFSKMIMMEHNNMEKSEIAEFMGLVYQAGMRLSKVVRKTMLYYKLEAMAINTDELSELQDQNSGETKMLIEDISKELMFDVGRKEDVLLLLCEGRVQMPSDYFIDIIRELIENALLYSPKRTKIKIVTGIDKDKLVLSISDEGIGMTPEQVASLGAFRQFNKDFNNQEGLGLGLTIAQRITNLFHGSMTINSNQGTGSTIKVFLPLAK